MKKLNKKGFTIVELVIVIAVIAILSAIMIPTFSGVIANAENSAAKSGANSTYQKYLLENADSNQIVDDFIYKHKDLYVVIINGQVGEDVYKTEADAVAAFGTTDNEGVAEPKYEVADAEAYKIVVEDDPTTDGVDEEERITFTGLYEVTPIA